MTVLRQYTPNDREALIELFLLNTPGYFHPQEQKDLEDYLDEEIEGYYVMEEDNTVIGCGGYNVEDDIGWLSWYIIHPGYQGKGVGRRLAQNSIDRLKEMSCITIIKVRTSQLVWKFYETLGFKLISTEKDFWGPGYDLYDMEFVK